MGTRTVRTTMQPGVEIEVDEAEFLDLQRSGLIFTGDGAKPATGSTEGEEK